MGVRVVRRAWSAAVTSVVVILVAGVIAGVAYGAWASRHPSWATTTTFNVSPLPGTGDPDRVIATQIEVLESRTQRDAVARALTAPAPFTIDAEQRRLSDVVEVTVTSPQRATATRAAAAIRATYPPRPDAVLPPTVRITQLDPPLAAARTDDVLRDAVLVGLGGAVLAVAALVLFSSLRPRVKRSYDVAPVAAVVLELPDPGRPGSPRRDACTAELRRLADHIIGVDGVDGHPRLSVSALARVDDATLDWVTDVLGGTSTDAAEPPEPGEGRGWSVIVARAGVDAELVLGKEVRSSAVFSEVMVVLVGAPRPTLVVPAPATDSAGGIGDDASSPPHRTGQTVWR